MSRAGCVVQTTRRWSISRVPVAPVRTAVTASCRQMALSPARAATATWRHLSATTAPKVYVTRRTGSDVTCYVLGGRRFWTSPYRKLQRALLINLSAVTWRSLTYVNYAKLMHQLSKMLFARNLKKMKFRAFGFMTNEYSARHSNLEPSWWRFKFETGLKFGCRTVNITC